MKMRKWMLFLLVMALAIPATAQNENSKTKKNAENELRQRVEQVWQAWQSKDLDKVATFYVKDPDAVFYDVAPLKYTGWNEYAEGVQGLLKTYQTLSFKMGDDLKIHPEGDWGWVTATLISDLVKPDGKHDNPPIRWTAIWKKQGGKWLIAHEHVSTPMQ